MFFCFWHIYACWSISPCLWKFNAVEWNINDTEHLLLMPSTVTQLRSSFDPHLKSQFSASYFLKLNCIICLFACNCNSRLLADFFANVYQKFLSCLWLVKGNKPPSLMLIVHHMRVVHLNFQDLPKDFFIWNCHSRGQIVQDWNYR